MTGLLITSQFFCMVVGFWGIHCAIIDSIHFLKHGEGHPVDTDTIDKISIWIFLPLAIIINHFI